MTDNPFDQFDAPQANGQNPFDQFDAPLATASSGPTQPSWYSLAQGALPFGMAPRIEAATAATKESLSGGLPWKEAYSQALTQYENAGKAQDQQHPVGTAIGKAIGSIAPLMLGGETINAGLESLGPTGRFLAGNADIPYVGRTASGQFAKLGPVEKAANFITSALSRTALMAREGAQAGAFGAAQNNGDIWQGATQGGELGGILGIAAAPVTSALSQVSKVPGMLAGSLPHWAQGGLGLLGGEKLLENLPELKDLALAHPAAGATVAGTAGLLGASHFLANHPEIRDLLTRIGIMGYGAANGAQTGGAGHQLSNQ